MPYGDLVIVLSKVLRIKRTLDGAGIDRIILDVETRKALAIEHRWRADWRGGVVVAAALERRTARRRLIRRCLLRIFANGSNESFGPNHTRTRARRNGRASGFSTTSDDQTSR